MVITITINPALDKSLVIDNFKIDKVNRINNMFIDAGGKGINVSKVLNKLDIKTTALSILGGNTGNTIKELLNKNNINHEEVWIKENTRTNTKIVDKINETCTDINEEGPEISRENIENLKNLVLNHAKHNKYVVLAGSVQSSVEKTIYKDIINQLKKENVKVALDTSGELLREGVKGNPWLIKPNLEELEQLVEKKLNSTEEIIYECNLLIKNGIENIVLTLGKDGILFFNSNKIIKVKVPKVRALSTVGAGDSVIASIIYGFINNNSLEEILKFAAGVGTATVTLSNTGVPDIETINNYKNQMVIEYIK